MSSATGTRRAKYDVAEPLDPARLKPNGAHALLVGQVPENSRVLDIGCATGYLGRYLIQHKHCRVDGLEADATAAAVAREFYGRVNVASAEAADAFDGLDGPYDVVLLAAVLEHLQRPDRLLNRVRDLLGTNGILIASLPNIAHWSVRWELLRGRWQYTDYGLLDRTHLRFYTLATARELIEQAGFGVQDVRWSNIGLGPLERPLKWLPRGRYRIRTSLLHRFPEWFAYEVVFVATCLPSARS